MNGNDTVERGRWKFPECRKDEEKSMCGVYSKQSPAQEAKLRDSLVVRHLKGVR